MLKNEFTETLEMTRDQFARIQTLGVEGLPNEVCGVLSGLRRKSDDGAVFKGVRQVISIDNDLRSPTEYCMNPRQLIQALKAFREQGLEWIGVFHSHPNSEAYPSQTDRRMAFWPGGRELLHPGLSHVILSLKQMDDPDLRSFQILADGSVALEPIIFSWKPDAER